MKRIGFIAIAVVTVAATLTLSGCGINWSRHEERLAASDAQENILAAGAPSVREAWVSVLADEDVLVTMTLIVDKPTFEATTLCHTIAAAVDTVPFFTQRLKIVLNTLKGQPPIEPQRYLEELGVTAENYSGIAVIQWEDAEALAKKCG